MSQQETYDLSKSVMRAIFMLMFAFIWSVAEMVLGAIAILQLVFTLVTKEPNPNLRTFGGALSEYLYQIARFVSFNSEDKPFPFSAWPSA